MQSCIAARALGKYFDFLRVPIICHGFGFFSLPSRASGPHARLLGPVVGRLGAQTQGERTKSRPKTNGAEGLDRLL